MRQKTRQQERVKCSNIAQLKDMGFSHNLSRRAVNRYASVEAAAAWILNQDVSSDEDDLIVASDVTPETTTWILDAPGYQAQWRKDDTSTRPCKRTASSSPTQKKIRVLCRCHMLFEQRWDV